MSTTIPRIIGTALPPGGQRQAPADRGRAEAARQRANLVRAMTEPKVATREQAMRSMTTHAFHRGIGFVDHGAPLPTPRAAVPGGNDCRPAGGALTPDGSLHLIAPPGQDAVPMLFQWVAREQAWARQGGHRLAFACAYLAAHGWRYLRPA